MKFGKVLHSRKGKVLNGLKHFEGNTETTNAFTIHICCYVGYKSLLLCQGNLCGEMFGGHEMGVVLKLTFLKV